MNNALAGILFFATMMITCEAAAVPVAVRFPEGITHGFLLVRSVAGDVIGQGELTQIVKQEDLVESRLVFTFKDGSLHEEHVAFSQQRVFTLIRYQLIQRGPSFPKQIDVVMDRGTSTYRVRSNDGENGKDEVLTGDVDVPKDAYNGMLITALLNLPKGASEIVHVIAFTPEPSVIKLELAFTGEQSVRIGDQSRKALHYAFKPDIGPIRKFFGQVMGKLPADFHYDCYILGDEVPAFVQFEGPLQLMGPILRIELVSPRMPLNEKQASR
ncbi:MAG TPA: hypothetical protein VFT92_04080 [Nitrospira sp.]|nr:hypothetical protein [Nitrospira sp.]